MVRDELPSPEEWAAVKREPVTPSGALPSGEASISAELLQRVIDAARAGLPNEACGLLVSTASAADGGVPTRYVPLRNAADSPYRYLIDPQEQLRVWIELDDADEVVWAIVHSHVASAAVPSATDVGLAFYPDSLYLICSLADPRSPAVRAWSIVDGVVAEVPLAVVSDAASETGFVLVETGLTIDVVSALRSAVPSFASVAPKYSDETDSDYVKVGSITRYVADCVVRGDHDELPTLFEEVERLLVEGNDEVKTLVVVEVLEGLHHLPVVRQFLGPETRRAWNGLLPYLGGEPA